MSQDSAKFSQRPGTRFLRWLLGRLTIEYDITIGLRPLFKPHLLGRSVNHFPTWLVILTDIARDRLLTDIARQSSQESRCRLARLLNETELRISSGISLRRFWPAGPDQDGGERPSRSLF